MKGGDLPKPDQQNIIPKKSSKQVSFGTPVHNNTQMPPDLSSANGHSNRNQQYRQAYQGILHRVNNKMNTNPMNLPQISRLIAYNQNGSHTNRNKQVLNLPPFFHPASFAFANQTPKNVKLMKPIDSFV